MAKNKTVIALSINAHIVIEGGIDKQAEALNLVKEAHETGNYSKVLAVATIDAVKAEMRRRRFETEAASTAPQPPAEAGNTPVIDAGNTPDPSADIDEKDIPAFIRKGK